MKFIYDIPGQTCNRFWSFIDLVGEAIIKNKKVIVLFPDKSFNDYPTLLNNNIIKFPFYKSACNKNSFYYKLLYNRLTFKFYNSKIGKFLGFVKGWDYCGSSLYFPKVKDQVIKLFLPSDEISTRAYKLINEYKENGYFVIGVHIRQGDYKTWRGGRYFFEQEEYATIIDYLSKMYSKKIVFYISSNVRIDEDLFSSFNIIKVDNASAAFDLEVLSLCDRIIGPLSTFSRWASLKGNVPLFILKKGLLPKSDEDFHKLVSLFKYDDGSVTIGKKFSNQ